jgi:hypothetical protein
MGKGKEGLNQRQLRKRKELLSVLREKLLKEMEAQQMSYGELATKLGSGATSAASLNTSGYLSVNGTPTPGVGLAGYPGMGFNSMVKMCDVLGLELSVTATKKRKP